MFIKPVERVLSFFRLNDEVCTFRVKRKKRKNKKVEIDTTLTLYGRNGMIAKWVIK